MKRSILTFLIVLWGVLSAWAQFDFLNPNAQNTGSTPDISKISLSVVPHYVAFYGIRVDLDKQNGAKANVFAPQFYYFDRPVHPVSFTDAQLNKLYGVGFMYNRKFIRSTNYNYTGYIALGFGYNYFYTQFQEFLPVQSSLYDNTVYLYKFQDITGQIHRLEVNATIGVANDLPIGILIEPYIGIGYRYSMPFYSQDIENPFDRAWDFAYSGPIFIAGVKFGFSKIL